MTETEWTLTKQVYDLQMKLAEAQAQICQANYNDAKRNLEALGNEWMPE